MTPRQFWITLAGCLVVGVAAAFVFGHDDATWVQATGIILTVCGGALAAGAIDWWEQRRR